MINMISAADQDRAESKDVKELEALKLKEKAEGMESLAGYIDNCWTAAREHKEQIVEPQIINNMRAIDGKYEESKLAAIKDLGGSEIFMMITHAKCRNAVYWMREILFSKNEKPWGIEPTPIPELPEFLKSKIYAETMLDSVMGALDVAQGAGVSPDTKAIGKNADEIANKTTKKALKMFRREARARAEQMELLIEDQFTEGNWTESLKLSLDNIVMHTGFVKGPFPKKNKKVIHDIKGGKLKLRIKDEIIPYYTSIHPINIYPAPDSTGINDGYLCERQKISPKSLKSLIGIKGYNEEEIKEVLKENKGKKTTEMLGVDTEIEELTDIDLTSHDSDKMDMIEFWGEIDGKKLLEWGADKSIITDEEEWYPVVCWKIGSHVIGFNLNKHPLGYKPYSKKSFEEKDGAFWGKGLPQIIEGVQSACNAATRAIVNNMAFASGPMVERNRDRIPPEDRTNNKMIPWKVWDSVEGRMGGGVAMNFYQPKLIVSELIVCFDKFSKIADEHSGIPAFAHGDSQVGGAGNTASGLSMLMASSSRGIKELVDDTDDKITKSTVYRQFLWNTFRMKKLDLLGDCKIVARGTQAILMKEQRTVRRHEYLTLTANPIDQQLMGQKGRLFLLKEEAKDLDYDIEDIFPDAEQGDDTPEPNLGLGQPNPPAPGQAGPPAPEGMPGGSAPPPAARALLPNGAPAGGPDQNLMMPVSQRGGM